MSKVIFLIECIILNFHIFNVPIYADEPLKISGYLEMVDVGELLPLHLELIDGHPYAFLTIDIYVDDELEISQKIISDYLDEEEFTLLPFSKYNQQKKIKVVANYYDTLGLDDSVVSFTTYSPSYKSYGNGVSETLDVKSNPIKASFVFKGSSQTVNYEYEECYMSFIHEYQLKDSRYVDFSKFYFILSDNIEADIDTFEFRLYTVLKGSDILVKKNYYSSLDIDVYEYAINHYEGINDYRFYINNKTGMIYESKQEDCDDELLPFFVPLSIKDTLLTYECVISDIGLNHNNYHYRGYLYLDNSGNDSDVYGQILNYKYVEIYTYLEDIVYA